MLARRLFRLKTIGGDYLDTQMKRCLSTFDITLLGVGHMIGAGIYVLTGSSLSLSLSSLSPVQVRSCVTQRDHRLSSRSCSPESRVYCRRYAMPNSVHEYRKLVKVDDTLNTLFFLGSAYTYTYITVGEFWAFIIGWNIILEHMLGAAAVARSWSGYFDSLLGHAIRNSTIESVGSLTVRRLGLSGFEIEYKISSLGHMKVMSA